MFSHCGKKEVTPIECGDADEQQPQHTNSFITYDN
jgi:hypothetical protein